jgi:hypothetical protein
MKRSITLRVDEEVAERLERVAELECASAASIVRKCVIRQLPALEQGLPNVTPFPAAVVQPKETAK